MNLLRSLSLRSKILIGTIFSSCLSVILASLIFVKNDQDRLHEAMLVDAETIAKIVAGNVLGPLTFEDKISATEALNSLNAKNTIIGAVIYDGQGKPFASYDRSRPSAGRNIQLPQGFPISAIQQLNQYSDDYLETSYPILENGITKGSVYLRTDLFHLESAINSIHRVAIFVAIGAALLACLISVLIQKSVVQSIRNILLAMEDIADGAGDLTQRLTVRNDDEIGKLSNTFNQFVEKVHGITCQYGDSTEDLTKAAQVLAQTTEKTSTGVIKQQQEIDQIAIAINQVTCTVQEVAQNVSMAAKDAEKADWQATQGKNIVGDTMLAIEGLASEIESASEVTGNVQKESDNIGAVLEVIGSITEQTNLLALNAAIEAARAGEQGRGFAVVADEVRTLASRTQSSTQEIREMIERLQSGAKQAVTMMESGRSRASQTVDHAVKAGESLEAITSAVSVIKDMTQQIASASEQQSTVTEEINQRIMNISQVANQTSEESRQIRKGSEDLATLATGLRNIISKFKL